MAASEILDPGPTMEEVRGRHLDADSDENTINTESDSGSKHTSLSHGNLEFEEFGPRCRASRFRTEKVVLDHIGSREVLE